MGRPAKPPTGKAHPVSPVRRPKLAHVAMAAGVSLGTASDALRDKGRISAETRARVKAAADDLGYRPHAHARVLALGHAQIVALVVAGRAGQTAPRIYWPRLQAAFTERLLEEGVVACTMSVTDLHLLDGLPFDLIVFAGVASPDDLPPGIRSAYRVLDLDLTGRSPLSRQLQEGLAEGCGAALTLLRSRGSRRPGLVLASPSAAPAQMPQIYRAWCREEGVEPRVVEVGPETGDEVTAALDDGVDGLFSVALDPDWLYREMAARGRDPATVPTVHLGSEPSTGPARKTFQWLTVDGEAIGLQLADLAIETLTGRVARSSVSVGWLVDGRPWDPSSAERRQ